MRLDERTGVSYPDSQQNADGVIHIIYDYNRTRGRRILFASFREEDAAKGKPIRDAVKLRQMVSHASNE
mgnify:FL=1